MNRREFSIWSRGLSDDDFACALAAAGVADTQNLLRVVKGVSYWRPVDTRTLNQLNARQLANAWKKLVRSHTDLRLSIPQPWTGFDPEWITECLTRPAVGLGSVSLSPGRWPQPTLLRQPRISIAGTLGDNSPYEILILRANLAEAGPTMQGITAKAVIAVGKMPGNSSDAAIQLEALRASAGAGAAGAVSVGKANEWFPVLRRELLRGIAFDIALTRSLREIAAPWRMVLIESEEWLERDAELTDFKVPIRQGIHQPIGVLFPDEEQDEAAPEEYEEEADGAEDFGGGRGGGSISTGPHGPGSSRPGGSAFVRRGPPRRLPGDILEPIAEPPLPRHVQARIKAIKTGATVFVPGSDHRIEVRIGPDDAAWIADRRVFDESKLPKSKSGHSLTVVFVEPELMRKPQTKSIHLPAAGSSSSCEFRLKLRENVEQVAARIIILYRRRVLQTSILQGRADGIAVPVLRPEVTVSAGFAGLDEQAEYDAALVFNHTAAGRATVTGIAGDDAVLLATGDLDKTVRKLEDALASADWGAKEFGSLDSPGTCELLLKLAAHGRLLTRQLEGKLKGLTEAKRIQLIAARPGARLPVEYFYAYAVPGDNWKLCPNAKQSLSTGVCGKSCGAIKDSDKYLCPLGFWGLSKILEWQTFRPASARELGAYDCSKKLRWQRARNFNRSAKPL